VTTQKKISEWFFPVVLSITLYKMGQTFESVDETLNVTIQMKATEHGFQMKATGHDFNLLIFVFQHCLKLKLNTGAV